MILQGRAEKDEARYYRYFSPRRPFLVPTWMERMAGKPPVFALNNWWAKYHQVDRGLKLPVRPEDF